MLDTIGKTWVHRLAAKVEIRLAGMADRPFADLVVEIEQPGLVAYLGAGLGRYQPSWRCRRAERRRFGNGRGCSWDGLGRRRLCHTARLCCSWRGRRCGGRLVM